MENRSIWLVSGRSPHKAALCGDPGISKLPGEINSPGSKVFASGKNAWTRQKARGRSAALRQFAGTAVSNLSALSSEHGKQIHLTGLRQIAPQSCALRGPRDFKTPGRNQFAREQGFCLRQKRLDAPKGAGPLRGPSAICRDSCFKFECSIIRTWRTGPSGWFPANRRRHPRPSAARYEF